MLVTSSLATVKTPTCVALGNFDGIHRGHCRVIDPILRSPVQPQPAPPDPSLTAARLAPIEPSAESCCGSSAVTVATFQPHPREFFTGQKLALLTPLAEKVQYLEAIGVEQLVLLPFDQALANLTPQAFVEQIVVQSLQAKCISVGKNFYFGKGRSGSAADLQAIAAEYGIAVQVVELHTADGERISSSAIRQALSVGDPVRAKQLLGRAYRLIGTVAPGNQLGRTLGFPTANLQLPAEKFLPQKGVYSVWVKAADWAEHQKVPGVMNLGDRPTVAGTRLTAEVHLLDWTGDLYGQQLTIELEHFLRPEQKFAGLEELKVQIQRDCELGRSQLRCLDRS